MKNTYLRNLYISDKRKKILLAALVAFPVWSGTYATAADEYVTPRQAIELPAPQAAQQQKSVSGLLTDADGNPVIGATVVIKGTTNGVTTDIDGHYTLKGVKNGDIIEYKFIGFNTEEREYKGEASINIRMMEAAVNLDDVVVIGYGQQKKESVVSSVNTITSKELQMPGRSLTNNIAGQIAGVLAVQRSGEPGNDNSSF